MCKQMEIDCHSGDVGRSTEIHFSMGNFLFCLMGDMSYTPHHHDGCWKAPLHCSELTDEQMIAFIVHRVRASVVFLAAFPSLLRKYVKALLHTWARGRGAMPLVSFMFLRDLCIQVGSNCLDTCLKGIYKAYLVNCKLSKSICGSKQQHIQILGNCARELYSLDPQCVSACFCFHPSTGGYPKRSSY
ncbi:Nucleolar complex protein 2-like protein [Zea mays]|uniref:Nucleolar complex protein 2-like protein n=2 Tax=Zea mays TaxID=4577 RepID=A0A1D6QNU6_MAIZE|nr:Nucleolar complex protein 2-like protein [Zea mays]